MSTSTRKARAKGFQIEPGPISTADKIKLIEALAETGLHHIQACSFVSPRIVPGWADAEDVVAGFTPKEGVHYTALWFNANGLEPGAGLPQQADDHRLDLADRVGGLHPEEPAPQPRRERRGDEASRPRCISKTASTVPRIGVMAAFGCNYQGDIAPAQVICDAGGRARDRRGGRRRHQVFLAGRHDGLGDADAHRARARRGAQPLARHADLRCTCTTRAASRSPTRMPG